MNRNEKKLYQKNMLSHNLVIIFILLNTIHAIYTLKTMTVDYRIGIFIMITIVISMVSFLAAIKLQNYSLLWSYVSIGMGIFQLSKFLYAPENIVGQLKINLAIILVISTISVVVGGIISIIRSNKRADYIKKYNADVELS